MTGTDKRAPVRAKFFPVQKRDYIERMIEQVATAIAAILGTANAGRFVDAERQLDEVWSSIGARRSDVLRLDDGTARMLLGPKVDLAARLLEAQAEVETMRGDLNASAILQERAKGLRRCARPP